MDPYEIKLKNMGCLEKHWAVLECHAETKDWRQCQTEVKDFRDCVRRTPADNITGSHGSKQTSNQ